MASRQFSQLQLVLDLAIKNEEEAAMRLYSLKQKLMAEEHRLQILLQYQREYQEKATVKSLQVMQGILYHNQQTFIKHITDAVTKQYQQIDKCKLMVDKQAQLWYSLKARTKALEQLILEMKQKLRQQEEKREQQLQDELIQHKRRSKEE